jgi:hypothetical protein
METALMVFFMGMCPISLLIGAGIATIIVLQLSGLRSKRTWTYITKDGLHPKDFEKDIRPLMEQGWDIDYVRRNETMVEFLDIRLRKYV